MWPDGGLKCWVEGHAYTAAEEPGFRFVVALNAKPYFVHISTEFGEHLITVSENADGVMELLVGGPSGLPAPTCMGFHAGWEPIP